MRINRRPAILAAVGILALSALPGEAQRGGGRSARPSSARPTGPYESFSSRPTPDLNRLSPETAEQARYAELLRLLRERDPALRLPYQSPTELVPDPTWRRTAIIEGRIQNLETQLRDAQALLRDARGVADRYRRALTDARLAALGYGAVAAAGSPAPMDAVRTFQHSEGLKVDGIVGPETAAALEAASNRTQRLALLDAQSEIKPLVLESHSDRTEPALYVLSGRQGILYRGNDASGLRIALEAQVTATSPVYVDASGFPRERLAALRSTLRISEAATGRPSLRFGLVESAHGLEALFRGVQIERVSEIEQRGQGYEATVDLTRLPEYGAPSRRSAAGQPLVVKVFSAAKELVTEFLEILRSYFHTSNGVSVYPGTVADAVHAARAELARRHGLTDEQLTASLRVEFGELELVLRVLPGDLPAE